MLLRNTGGIAQSISKDGGRTWSAGEIHFKGRTFSSKRFFLRRLPSGALLLVRNDAPDGSRSRLTAFISDDDGGTWTGESEVFAVGKPFQVTDMVVAQDGALYVTTGGRRTQGGLYRISSVRPASIFPPGGTLELSNRPRA